MCLLWRCAHPALDQPTQAHPARPTTEHIEKTRRTLNLKEWREPGRYKQSINSSQLKKRTMTTKNRSYVTDASRHPPEDFENIED